MAKTCIGCEGTGHQNDDGHRVDCRICEGSPDLVCGECGCGEVRSGGRVYRCDCPGAPVVGGETYIDGWRFVGDDLTAYHQSTGVLAGIDSRGVETTSRCYPAPPLVVAELQRRFAVSQARKVAA